QLVVAHAHPLARAAGRRQQPQLLHGKPPLLKEADQLRAHRPGRADDGHIQCSHVHSPILPRRPSLAGPATTAVPHRELQRTGRCSRWMSRGCSCRPSKAATTVSVISRNSATHEYGFTSGLSWPKGTKNTCLRVSSSARLSALPLKISLLET